MSKFDAFLFFNELDVLKIRLEELYPVIDRFYLVESNKTFRGNDKPYYFDENKSLFDKYLDKICHIKLVDPGQFSMEPSVDPWMREVWTRDRTADYLDDVDGNDILVFGDVDEIPRREAVENLNPDPIVTLEMLAYTYRLNLYDHIERATKAIRVFMLYSQDLEKIRRTPPDICIPDAGWHFSSLGDANHVASKFKAFSHTEIDIPQYTDVDKIQDRINRMIDPMDRSILTKVEVDDTWPVEVVNNLEYWRKYIA